MTTPVCSAVTVRVPATSANLGSGFDTAGLALEYFDELTFTLNDDPMDGKLEVIIHGEGEDSLPRDEHHLVVSTFRKACEQFGLGTLGFTLEATNNIPQARGMGSSAEAIVAAIAAAAAFAADGDLDRQQVFALAAKIEGHPDNVAPAVFGGLTVSWQGDDDYHTANYPVTSDMHATVFVPDFELSTEKARQALPSTVAYADAIYNVSRVGLLPMALNPTDADQANDLLLAATQDKLHQPYRASLMQPSTDLIAQFREQGYAAAVSGAGPCVLVLHYGDADTAIDQVAAEALAGGHWKALHLAVNTTGVQVTRA